MAAALATACAITSSSGETLKLAKDWSEQQAAQLATTDLDRSGVRFLIVEGSSGPTPGLDSGCTPLEQFVTAIAPDGEGAEDRARWEQRATGFAQGYNATVVTYLVANKRIGRYVRCRGR